MPPRSPIGARKQTVKKNLDMKVLYKEGDQDYESCWPEVRVNEEDLATYHCT
jgi:hypothetical protein